MSRHVKVDEILLSPQFQDSEAESGQAVNLSPGFKRNRFTLERKIL